MLFKCPVCNQRTILFPVVFLHAWGAWGDRHNIFECTHCHSALGSSYAPLPFMVIGAILTIFITQQGGMIDMVYGGLIFSLLVMLVYPIRHLPQYESASSLIKVRSFSNPLDQALHYLESRLLSLLFAVLVPGLLYKTSPQTFAEGRVLIVIFPLAILSFIAGFLYVFVIYRVGRKSFLLRMIVDTSVILGVLFVLWL